jgi:hypothetical protein
MAPETAEGERSFDLFRNPPKDVAIVTFDELLEKVDEIQHLLAAGTRADEDRSSSAPYPSGFGPHGKI